MNQLPVTQICFSGDLSGENHVLLFAQSGYVTAVSLCIESSDVHTCEPNFLIPSFKRKHSFPPWNSDRSLAPGYQSPFLYAIRFPG